MTEQLNDVTLKSGERVQAVVVSSPDTQWHGRITTLLAHKAEIWRWQVAQLLSPAHQASVEIRFYLLHRDGVPFSNIMTVECQGVGLFGHVWTQPEDRGQGAASELMRRAMNHFRERGGKALYLGTGFETGPYHIYRKFGFESVEPGSGTMRYSTEPLPQFEAEYFAPGKTEIVPFGWPQWAVASALFTGSFPGVVRSVPFKLLGRALTEEALLPLVRQETAREADELPRAQVLQKAGNGALVGFAAWDFDPLWPDTCRIDMWCHPHFWEHGLTLLQSLKLPNSKRLLAWSDAACEAKAEVLKNAEFRELTTLPQWVTAAGEDHSIDVTMWEKSRPS